MSSLPVIVGFGGFNAAGRSSFHHAYKRMVIESLPASEQEETLLGLATMMKLVRFENGRFFDNARENNQQTLTPEEVVERFSEQILNSTLIRTIEKSHFDVNAVHWQKNVTMHSADKAGICFELTRKQLPEPIPSNWQLTDIDKDRVKVNIIGEVDFKVDTYRECPVKVAGQLPSGFNPEDHYNARFHPRALQMAIMGASDAIRSLGMEWKTIADAVKPDEIGVYASNAMSQLDENGFGGMLQSRLKGGRVSTKQCPLGLNTMPADFVNAYVLGNVGHTSAIVGACASFLYNLSAAIEDIKSGKRRVAVVGNAEAPILPEVIDGYATMGALASEDNLKRLDQSDTVDHRRASRPFGENCGFTIAESTQYVVLMDDALALELGADIHGAVSDVFINADGYKKSISAPGPGNYITMAKAVAAARAIVGDESVRERSFIQAHGSSTPANRTTESRIFHDVAKIFDIQNWPVTAAKAYLGHPLSPASAEQLVVSLGVFKHGFIPGIKTIDKVADDVFDERLNISITDIDKGAGNIDVAFLNSKGFGGNNATATLLSPHVVDSMLAKRYSSEDIAAYESRREQVREKAMAYDLSANQGNFDTIYHFGQDLIKEDDIQMTSQEIRIAGFANPIDLRMKNPFEDMI
ncbi:beta-ketoacyl synthase [Paraglaciecola sp. T6c]|uniref:beta-ketoacyl synthase n=1 Tax=Pseudoalteromonas atlantica (strain T6c / ATCC BAA-1087) TaxID=3042615 RepID=UPI00005C5C55|nr:beta-ketoacyl synthase [Paraglaciecola sp. T6c]ABG42279.1 beta-ketoacyl synthase [Paraglaciecola sp. T6c]